MTPAKSLDTFPNPEQQRPYWIESTTSEFTCLCPKTGQPDFATITLRYIPKNLCIELKSLKLYLWSFRNEGHFHEQVINRILDDLVATCAPWYMEVSGEFNLRGGIATSVRVQHGQVPVGPLESP